MKKILVGVDGSLASIHAAKLGLELSKGLGAELTLIHVQPPTVLPGDTPIAPLAELREYELANGAAILNDVLRVLGVPGIKTLNVIGPPSQIIADTALDAGFDLVVVGNTGRSPVSRVLLGSVADRLVHLCKRPVLVVR